ncbi:acyl-CoA dehydrogenase/oxidase [Phyllosticta citriasiana]|uniref:Acyl-CoA dehydrogenase/oxidase n=1 Tax=Phyllosticta citriasiana TaxID=595635 RepID=A0ABR1KDN2_9PEZI
MTPKSDASLSKEKGDVEPTRAPHGPWAEPAFHSLSSPYYKPSHYRLQAALRNYIDKNVLPHALDWEAAGAAPREAALAWARSGIAYSDVPTAYRPAWVGNPAGIPWEELDAFHYLIMVDEGSRIEGGVGTSLEGASVIAAPPIIHWGSEEQKRKWLPGLFDWTTSFALGVTEPRGGSDVAALTTTAEKVKTEDGKEWYVVNGVKKWITGFPWATHMTTAVRTGPPGSGANGISVLVIPTNSQGLTWHRIENSGQKAGGASWVELEDVRVPAENLIGRENDGLKMILTNFNRERFTMAVGMNRKARTCLAHAFAYACRRETFGKPLIENQIIRHKIATMAREIEAHWAWLEQIAYHVQGSEKKWQDANIAGRIALIKVQGGRLVEMANREAQQIFGGAGYQRSGVGATVEQISRDLRMLVVGGGSEEILEDLGVRQETALATRKGWKL